MRFINTTPQRFVQALLIGTATLAMVGSAQAQTAPRLPMLPTAPTSAKPPVSPLPRPPYRFTTIDEPGAPGTSLYGISAAGIVGTFGGVHPGITAPQQGFLFAGGKFTTIDRPGATDTTMGGINNAGVIVGTSDEVAWMRSASGQFANVFDFASHGVTVFGSGASGINNAGDIVGSFLASNLGDFVSPTGFGFFVQHGRIGIGNPTVISVPNAINTSAQAINDSGQIVGFYDTSQGTRGFLRASNETLATIYVPNSGDTDAFGINNSGIIVGAYNGVSGEPGDHGYVWNSVTGSFITLDVPGATDTGATGIDDDNNIVGQYITDDITHGFLASPLFAGVPGRSNCIGVTIQILVRDHGGILEAADALEFANDETLENAIFNYCGGVNIASR